MESTYTYRLFKHTWGVAIDITAEAVPLSQYKGEATEVVKGLWFALGIDWELTAGEKQYLETGLRLVSNEIGDEVMDEPIVIRVVDILFNPTDFQEEGLAYAMAGWMAQAFGIAFVPPPVEFDKERNLYNFPLPIV